MSDMSYPTKEKSQFMNVQGGEKKVMKKILSVALSTAMAFSMFASVAFGETATTPQAKFDALAVKGVLNGYPDGQSHLEKDLTRAEFAKIVTKLFDLTEVTNKLSYKDKGYTASNWAVPYIEAVTAANLMQGKDTVKRIFDYNGKVTVEEVAAVLFRALKLETPATTDNTASAWAKGYAQAVINAGLVAQSTNFKANASRSLVVETAYAVDQMTSVPTLTVASAEATSPTQVVVTFSDKTTTTVELTTALVAGVETTINFKHLEKDYTAKVTLQAPKVVSVTAPNAKQLVVKFNRTVDADTLTETDSSGNTTLLDGVIAVTRVGSTGQVVTADRANVILSADGTEAVLSFQNLEYLDGQYTVVVDDSILTTSGEAIPAYTTLLSVDDTTAPTVSSVSATAKTTTNKVYLKLSEPVKTSGLIAYVNGVSATVSRDTYSPLDEVTLTTTALTSGATYDVSLTNLSDYAGNYVSPNPTKTTVTVSSDTAAPTITKAEVTGEKEVTVTFDKNMKYSSLVGNVRLLDANGASKGYFSVSATSNPKVFVFKNNNISYSDSTSFVGSMVFAASVSDTVGNTFGSAVTQAVTFSKDTIAPSVTSATYSSTKGLVVKFSEPVTQTSNVGIKLINDATGGVVNVTTNATYSNDGKTLTFATSAVSSGSYTLRFPSGVIKDRSIAANSLPVTTVAVTVSATSTSDSVIPVATVTSLVYTNDTTEKAIRLSITDNTELNIATVRDVNSYTLDGAALPANSYVETSGYSSTDPDQAVVTIYMPASAFDATESHDFSVTGVADAAGNLVDADAATFHPTFTDAVSPNFTKLAVSSSDGKILTLTFDEAVYNVDATDFQFVVNGETTVSSAGAVFTASADSTVWYVTFPSYDFSASTVYSISAHLVDGSNIKDAANNTVNDDVTIYAD
jgi:hypothetical protein